MAWWQGAKSVECPVLHCGAPEGTPCIGVNGSVLSDYLAGINGLNRSANKAKCKYHIERYALFEEKVLKEQEASKAKSKRLLDALSLYYHGSDHEISLSWERPLLEEIRQLIEKGVVK